MYRDMMNDLASSWKDILQAQSIAVNHIPEIRKQEISRGFGKKETVYTVSESDAYNIQALYKRVTAERIYNIDKVLQQLPKITKAVNTLYEQTKALGQVIQQPSQQEIIQRLQQRVSQQSEELDEFKQFINDYNLGAYLEEWKQEQQEQIPNIPEPEIPTPTSLDYMDIGR